MKSLPFTRIRAAALAFALGMAVASQARPIPFPGEPTGLEGKHPALWPNQDDTAVFLLVSAPYASIRRFDLAAATWGATLPPAPQTDSLPDPSRGGWHACAIDAEEHVHVVWAENGTSECGTPPLIASQRILHVAYDGTGWEAVQVLREHVAGECWVGYPTVASDGAGRLVSTYANWVTDVRSVYILSDGTNPWSSEYFLENSRFQTATGRGGKLYIGYNSPAAALVGEIASGSTSVTQIGSFTNAPLMTPAIAASEDGTLDVFYVKWAPNESSESWWHVSELYYNRYEGGWQHGNGFLVADSSLFTSPPPETAGDTYAGVGLAVLSSGRRVFAISYLNKLYAVAYDGSEWSAPQELETGGDVSWADAHAVEPDRVLVVWSTGDSVDSPVEYALLGADLCSYCGPGETCERGTCVASEQDYEQERMEPVDAADDVGALDDGSMVDGDASGHPDGAQDAVQDGPPGNGVTEGGCGCSIHG